MKPVPKIMFAHELAPVPSVMVDGDGEMMIAKNKSDLRENCRSNLFLESRVNLMLMLV